MVRILRLPLLILILLKSGISIPLPAEDWRTITLSDDFTVSWLQPEDLLSPDSQIRFRVEARTHGWVGLGINHRSRMPGADIVIAGVHDATGEGYIQDRHATANAEPMIDSQQNYKLISAEQNETHTIVEFQRSLKTCDSDDIDIGLGTFRLLHAHHKLDLNEDGSGIQKHERENRGVRTVGLLGKHFLSQNFSDPDAFSIDLTVKDVTIPSDHHTQYVCRMFQLPKLNGKHHMIQMETLIDADSAPYIHHMLLYHCRGKVYGSMVGRQELCVNFKTGAVSEMFACSSGVFGGWAVGGLKIKSFPKEAGYAFNQDDTPDFIMLDLHYDNSAYHEDTKLDNSGMRLWLTPNLRETDYYVLEVGNTVYPPRSMFIPPKQETFTTYSYCKPNCMQHMSETGIKIHSVLLHQHVAGTGMTVRHIRDGVELPNIAKDEFYDFNYQQFSQLERDVTVLPTDTLIVECNLTTVGRDSVLLAGFSTQEEMCLAFIGYYAKNNDNHGGRSILTCKSRPNMKTLADALNADQYNATDDTLTINGVSLAGSGADFTAVDWAKMNVSRVQEVLRNGVYEGSCAYATYEDENNSITHKVDEESKVPFPEEEYKEPVSNSCTQPAKKS